MVYGITAAKTIASSPQPAPAQPRDVAPTPTPTHGASPTGIGPKTSEMNDASSWLVLAVDGRLSVVAVTRRPSHSMLAIPWRVREAQATRAAQSDRFGDWRCREGLLFAVTRRSAVGA